MKCYSDNDKEISRKIQQTRWFHKFVNRQTTLVAFTIFASPQLKGAQYSRSQESAGPPENLDASGKNGRD